MKILIYVNHWIPGANSTHAYELTKGCLSRGHEVTLVLFRATLQNLKKREYIDPELKLEVCNSFEPDFLVKHFGEYEVYHNPSFSDAESNAISDDVIGTGIRLEFSQWWQHPTTAIHTAFVKSARELARIPLQRPFLNHLDQVFHGYGEPGVRPVASWVFPLKYEEDIAARRQCYTQSAHILYPSRVFEYDEEFVRLLEAGWVFDISADMSYSAWSEWLMRKYPQSINPLGFCRFSEEAERYLSHTYSFHTHFGYSVIKSWKYGTIPIIPDHWEHFKIVDAFGKDLTILISGVNCITLSKLGESNDLNQLRTVGYQLAAAFRYEVTLPPWEYFWSQSKKLQ